MTLIELLSVVGSVGGLFLGCHYGAHYGFVGEVLGGLLGAVVGFFVGSISTFPLLLLVHLDITLRKKLLGRNKPKEAVRIEGVWPPSPHLPEVSLYDQTEK